MRTRATVVGLVASLVLLSGCAASSSAPAASQSPTTKAPPPTVGAETGSIAGTVVDDEQLPVPGATVALLETPLTVEADPAGAFTFNEITPGTYGIVAQALGYEQTARKVDVSAGEVTKVTLTLKALTIRNESFTHTIPKTVLFHAGQSFTYLYTVPVVNLSSLHDVFCNPCSFVLHHPASPKAILTEPTWAGDTACPNVNCDIWIYYKSTWTNAWYIGDGTLAYYGYHDNRVSKLWSPTQVDMLKGKDKVLLAFAPSYYGSLEQKVTDYTSFAYHGDFPEGFTALPPN